MQVQTSYLLKIVVTGRVGPVVVLQKSNKEGNVLGGLQGGRYGQVVVI